MVNHCRGNAFSCQGLTQWLVDLFSAHAPGPPVDEEYGGESFFVGEIEIERMVFGVIARSLVVNDIPVGCHGVHTCGIQGER